MRKTIKQKNKNKTHINTKLRKPTTHKTIKHNRTHIPQLRTIF